MKKEFLKKLLAKYIAGKISDDEKKILDNWYDSFEMDEGYLNKLTDAEKDELEKKLSINIDQGINSFEKANTPQERTIAPFSTKYKATPYSPYGYKIAAVFIGIILFTGLAYIFLHNNKVIHSTAYGQILQVTLPDSSKVILNGNTTLSYDGHWVGDDPREVYLEGEAFFSVVHTDHNQKFIVNTSNQIKVEVLGTEFNVSKRESGTRVVLNSGKVRLNYMDLKNNRQVVMDPGDLLEFNDSLTDYIKKEVNAETYSSWKDKKLMLDHTSLSEIVTMLEDVHGLRTAIFDNDLLAQKVSGSIPAENIDMLLENISVPYGIKIIKNKDFIEIRKASKN